MRERSGDARRERGARQPRCHLRRGCPNVRPGTRRAGGSGVASKRASVARRRCAPDRTRDALARPDAPRATDGGAPSSGRNGLHRGCWPCLAELQICPARTLNKSDRQDVDRDVPNCTRGCRGYRSARAIREMDRGGAASESVCSIAPRPPPVATPVDPRTRRGVKPSTASDSRAPRPSNRPRERVRRPSASRTASSPRGTPSRGFDDRRSVDAGDVRVDA